MFKNKFQCSMQAVVVGLAMTALGSAVAQTKWDLPTAYSANSFQTENVQFFVDELDKKTAGKIKMTMHPNASLYKANEIKRAVQTGQVPIGEFILSGAANENPLFGIDSIPFLTGSYADAKKLYIASKPALEKLLASQGMKLLYSVPWPGQSLYSVKPITGPDDLKGTKMRAYNPATTRIATLLKSQPATIQLAELGQALATGTVDNFFTGSASGVESKLYEQAKFLYVINAWMPRNAVVVSQKVFDGLDKGSQDAMLAAAGAAEQRGWQVSEQKDGEYIKELAAKGMKIGPPSDSLKKELAAIGQTMTAEWLKTAGPEGQAVVDAYRK